MGRQGGRTANPDGRRLRMEGVRMGEWPEPGETRAGQAADLGGLLALVARGDQAAFEAVYDGVVPAVFGLVRRGVRDPAQSEAVTHDALLEAWRPPARCAAAQRGPATR